MASFFSFLRYSFGNEDWRTEEEALDIQPGDCVLSITASGDRPLNLLKRKCDKLVCIDANPTQNYLLQLKVAAMKHLDFEDYLSFLGAREGNNREQSLQKLLPFMDPKAATFWRTKQKMVSKGIIYQGTVERLTYFVAKIFSLLKGKKVERLFAMNDLEEQKRFVKEQWNSYTLRKLLSIILNPYISRWLIKDPGLVNVANNINPGTYIYDRIQMCLENELAKKIPLLSLIMRGKVGEEAFSPHLTQLGVEAIKPNLTALEIHTVDILTYLESIPGPTFDAFSFSDVISYLSYSDFNRLLQNMVRTAKPGARFCLRQFLTSYEIPLNFRPFFKRDFELEKKLEEKDNCFVYRFLTGQMPQISSQSREIKEVYAS